MKFELSSDVHVMSLSLCWYRIIKGIINLDVFVLLKLIRLNSPEPAQTSEGRCLQMLSDVVVMAVR